MPKDNSAQIQELQDTVQTLQSTVKELQTKIEGLGIKPINTDRFSLPLSVSEKNAVTKQIVYPVTTKVHGINAATASNYGVFFVADKTYTIDSITEVHGTAGTDGGAVTLQIERLQSTEALDSGDTLLSAAFNLKGTANTVQYGELVRTNVLILGIGDRLSLKDSGTLTSVADVVVTVTLSNI